MLSRMPGISSVHDDLIAAHILPRLDGLSLSSFTCVSPSFRSVVDAANQRRLWRHVTASTWPSTNDPRIQRLITNYHRTFFSESFPLLTGDVISNPDPSMILTEELISAVDIYYKNEPVFSRVQETETGSGWFMHSPFRIDLLGPKEWFRVGPFGPDELTENLKLSWIVIDPTRKTSANLSSFDAVALATERHWLTGEISVRYSTVISVDGRLRAVEVEVKGVTCDGEMHVREVGMRVEDVEGKWMNGKGSLGILVNVMECGVRKIDKEGFRGRERYGKYLHMKRVWREGKEMRERYIGMACVGVAVLIFVGFLTRFLFYNQQ